MDCPPRCRSKLADPSVPLWVTESNGKKTDAIAQAGFYAVGVNGVYGYKGRNQFGGVAWLADWDYISLKGRKVIIGFDSDTQTNSNVRRARAVLTEHFRREGTRVKWVDLPSGPNGEKVGIDDYLLTHSPRQLLDLVQDAPGDLDTYLESFNGQDASEEDRIRDLENQVTELKAIIRGVRAVLANPAIKAEKATLVAFGFDYFYRDCPDRAVKRQPDPDGWLRTFREDLAEDAGNTPQTAGAHLKVGAQFGVIDREVVFDRTTKKTELRLRTGASTLPEYLGMVATMDPETKKRWGGKRCKSCGSENLQTITRCLDCGHEEVAGPKVHLDISVEGVPIEATQLSLTEENVDPSPPTRGDELGDEFSNFCYEAPAADPRDPAGDQSAGPKVHLDTSVADADADLGPLWATSFEDVSLDPAQPPPEPMIELCSICHQRPVANRWGLCAIHIKPRPEWPPEE